MRFSGRDLADKTGKYSKKFRKAKRDFWEILWY